MISLHEATMSNFSSLSDLKVADDQKDFIGTADWILALAYADRAQNAHAMAIVMGEKPIGLVMTSEFTQENEPGFYYLPQFFIDVRYQRRGYGRQALKLVLDKLSAEKRFDSVRLDVDHADIAAISLYRSLGFHETGYSDPAHPGLLFLGLDLSQWAHSCAGERITELSTASLIMRTVNENDVNEVARMWELEGPISAEEAQKAIEYMQNNHRMNIVGNIHHICFAVFEKEKNDIVGWCGLDGKTAGKLHLFYSIDSKYRNRGYATQCAAKLLSYAFDEAQVSFVNGGCAKDNIASFKVLIKIGMIENDFEENGDPLFLITKEQYRNINV
jgi:RimJ/RimL family protein N-acetyltransferase